MNEFFEGFMQMMPDLHTLGQMTAIGTYLLVGGFIVLCLCALIVRYEKNRE